MAIVAGVDFGTLTVRENLEMGGWLDPAATRRHGSIILMDRSGQEKIRWNFVNAWPVKWTGPSFNAKGKDISIETLELAHEGLERAE